jgi:nicotinamidase-related amidase
MSMGSAGQQAWPSHGGVGQNQTVLLRNGPVQSWPPNGQMFLSPWQQGATAVAQQPVIPETQPLAETWRRQYVPAATMSWRPSEDPPFISAEQSPAMFHMDVEGIYDHVVEVSAAPPILCRVMTSVFFCSVFLIATGLDTKAMFALDCAHC